MGVGLSLKRAHTSASRRGHRGIALGTILLSMLVFSFVLFTAVSASISHLKLVEGTVRGDHARNLAEAALSKALSELISSNFAFGQNASDRVEHSFPGLPDGTGVVTFDAGESGFSQGYSTFNLNSDSRVVGAGGHSVPARTVHLVARGKVGHTERWMECYYYKPPFPDGLAASGPIVANALQLLGVRDTQTYIDTRPNPVPPDAILPANLFSNATDGLVSGQPASMVGPASIIRGSAGAVGGVGVDPTAVIDGEVLPGSEPRPIPEMDIDAKILAMEPSALVPPYAGGNLSLPANWFARWPGNLNVTGDLDLNGTALSVAGDLVVTGAVKGTGVVLATGNVEIRGGNSTVTSTDQVAVACKKDFSIDGVSQSISFFQGLMYCEGDFQASDITVVGATVVNGKGPPRDPARGWAKLDNVDFVQVPGTITMALLRPQGIEFKTNHYFAVSLTLRRAANGAGYLCDARAYFCDDGGGVAPIKDNPRLWRELFNGSDDWPLQPGGPGDPLSADSGSDHFRAMSLENIAIGSPTPALVKTNLSDPIKAWLKDVVDLGIMNGWNDSDGAFLEPALWSYVQAMTNGTPNQYIVTFNLNNLMSEVSGSSRVLIWRPFRPNP